MVTIASSFSRKKANFSSCCMLMSWNVNQSSLEPETVLYHDPALDCFSTHEKTKEIIDTSFLYWKVVERNHIENRSIIEIKLPYQIENSMDLLHRIRLCIKISSNIKPLYCMVYWQTRLIPSCKFELPWQNWLKL